MWTIFSPYQSYRKLILHYEYALCLFTACASKSYVSMYEVSKFNNLSCMAVLHQYLVFMHLLEISSFLVYSRASHDIT